jgi:hypothetical protein
LLLGCYADIRALIYKLDFAVELNRHFLNYFEAVFLVPLMRLKAGHSGFSQPAD